MKKEELEQLISEIIDKKLSTTRTSTLKEDTVEIAHHLKACPECKKAIKEIVEEDDDEEKDDDDDELEEW